MPCKRKRRYRRKRNRLNDLTDLTIDASKMLIATSASLRVATQISKTLKK